MLCKRCNQDKEAHADHPHLCVDCVKAEDSRLSFYRQHNFNWMDVAKEACIEVWERQPQETDREWQIWLAYRDAYPGIKPSYSIVAKQLGTTINVVKKVGQRWTFVARMQAWAKYVDAITMQQRQKEIVDMNKAHIDMATVLRGKLATAIDLINPEKLAPNEIQGLFKLVTEIERKARVDERCAAEMAIVGVEDENPELKKSPTKTEDISEILAILGKTGVLNGTDVGVRKTTTTEIIVKGE